MNPHTSGIRNTMLLPSSYGYWSKWPTLSVFPHLLMRMRSPNATTSPAWANQFQSWDFQRCSGGTEGAVAILRDGKIASYSAGSSREWEKFLINASVYSGDSGGPGLR